MDQTTKFVVDLLTRRTPQKELGVNEKGKEVVAYRYLLSITEPST